MIENEKANFEKLKNEGVITGDYLNLCKFFETKNNVNKKEFFSFSQYMGKEIARIKELYFKDEYHTMNHWITNYLLAKEYYNEYGNLLPKIGEVYEKYGYKIKIDAWVLRQRYLEKNGRLIEKQ